ncbi:hypothetical protein B0H14DRAFT_2785182 [Mycena olivaceomarginata]|nr:hypothetical protein B0H14DRAFT_2785182 [Mycena olivaceomarginata]
MDSALCCKKVISGSVTPEPEHVNQVCADLNCQNNFHKLPFEMTAEIFTHCLPKYPLRSIPSESAMLLGQVCRQWREISISSPRIWQSLQLELTPKIHPQQVIRSQRKQRKRGTRRRRRRRSPQRPPLRSGQGRMK